MITDGITEIVAGLTLALIIGLGGYVVRVTRQRRTAEKSRDHKLDRLLEGFEGAPADPLAGAPARTGVLERMAELETGQRALQRQLAGVQAMLRNHLEDGVAHRLNGNGPTHN